MCASAGAKNSLLVTCWLQARGQGWPAVLDKHMLGSHWPKDEGHVELAQTQRAAWKQVQLISAEPARPQRTSSLVTGKCLLRHRGLESFAMCDDRTECGLCTQSGTENGRKPQAGGVGRATAHRW